MSGDWIILFHDPEATRAKDERRFETLDGLYAALLEYREQASGELLMVHVPSRATDDERQRIMALGFQTV